MNVRWLAKSLVLLGALLVLPAAASAHMPGHHAHGSHGAPHKPHVAPHRPHVAPLAAQQSEPHAPHTGTQAKGSTADEPTGAAAGVTPRPMAGGNDHDGHDGGKSQRVCPKATSDDEPHCANCDRKAVSFTTKQSRDRAVLAGWSSAQPAAVLWASRLTISGLDYGRVRGPPYGTPTLKQPLYLLTARFRI